MECGGLLLYVRDEDPLARGLQTSRPIASSPGTRGGTKPNIRIGHMSSSYGQSPDETHLGGKGLIPCFSEPFNKLGDSVKTGFWVPLCAGVCDLSF